MLCSLSSEGIQGKEREGGGLEVATRLAREKGGQLYWLRFSLAWGKTVKGERKCAEPKARPPAPARPVLQKTEKALSSQVDAKCWLACFVHSDYI